MRGSAPELGQDTELELLNLGFDWSDIERMHDAGITAVKQQGAAAAGD